MPRSRRALPWPPPSVRDQLDAHLERLGMTQIALARRLRVDTGLITQVGRTRPKLSPVPRPKRGAKGVRPVQDRRVKLPVRLVERVIRALKLKGQDAHLLRIAALLDHAPRELVRAIQAGYPSLRQEP